MFLERGVADLNGDGGIGGVAGGGERPDFRRKATACNRPDGGFGEGQQQRRRKVNLHLFAYAERSPGGVWIGQRRMLGVRNQFILGAPMENV